MEKKDRLKIGDTVNWCGGFGVDKAKKAVIESINKGRFDGDKDGDEVKSAPWSQLQNSRRYTVSLTNGHWAWANQISKV